jgi:hypothetical protein
LPYEGKKQSKNGGNEFNAYRVALQAVGEHKPGAAFKVPEPTGPDLGLRQGAEVASPWGEGTAPF